MLPEDWMDTWYQPGSTTRPNEFGPAEIRQARRVAGRLMESAKAALLEAQKQPADLARAYVFAASRRICTLSGLPFDGEQEADDASLRYLDATRLLAISCCAPAVIMVAHGIDANVQDNPRLVVFTTLFLRNEVAKWVWVAFAHRDSQGKIISVLDDCVDDKQALTQARYERIWELPFGKLSEFFFNYPVLTKALSITPSEELLKVREEVLREPPYHFGIPRIDPVRLEQVLKILSVEDLLGDAV